MVLIADGIVSVYIVDVGDGRLVLSTQHRSESSPDDIVEMEGIIDSLDIDP